MKWGAYVGSNVVFQDLGLFALFGLPATLAAGAVAALATRTRLPE